MKCWILYLDLIRIKCPRLLGWKRHRSDGNVDVADGPCGLDPANDRTLLRTVAVLPYLDGQSFEFACRYPALEHVFAFLHHDWTIVPFV